jgi:hypothetical protein
MINVSCAITCVSYSFLLALALSLSAFTFRTQKILFISSETCINPQERNPSPRCGHREGMKSLHKYPPPFSNSLMHEKQYLYTHTKALALSLSHAPVWTDTNNSTEQRSNKHSGIENEIKMCYKFIPPKINFYSQQKTERER